MGCSKSLRAWFAPLLNDIHYASNALHFTVDSGSDTIRLPKLRYLDIQFQNGKVHANSWEWLFWGPAVAEELDPHAHWPKYPETLMLFLKLSQALKCISIYQSIWFNSIRLYNVLNSSLGHVRPSKRWHPSAVSPSDGIMKASSGSFHSQETRRTLSRLLL